MFVVVGIVLIYLLRNMLRSFHDRVFEGLSKGIISEEGDRPRCDRPPGESGN
jgi:hypothetical protein